MMAQTQIRSLNGADYARQTAAESLNMAIVRLAIRREQPADPRQRAEMSTLVNQALQAYRDYMRLAAAT